MAAPHPSLNEYIDLLLDAICVVDPEGRYVYVSAGFERIFGYAPEEVIGTRMIELVHPDDRERTLRRASEIMAGGPDYHFENRYVRKDGEVVDIMWSARWSEDHRMRIAVARDVTRRKRAETVQAALYAISEATHAAEDLRTLFQQIHRIVGTLLPASSLSIALHDEKSGDVSVTYHLPEDAVVRSQSSVSVPLRTRKGTIGSLTVQSDAENAYVKDDEELLQFVSRQIADAIERKQVIASLRQTALYDRLTRLPNRALFHDRMQAALARVRRDHVRLSLLYIDLDKFKEVNDTFGHAAGDLLLQKIARRLEECVRARDTVARFGGDELVVLLENVSEPEHTAGVIEKIRSALEQPFDLAGRQATIQASIGVAHCPLHGDDEDQLLAHADQDMYAQKSRRQSAEDDAR